ncbi:MAG: hypothetical protein MJ194_07325 [Clostridia bacterium]|nr:hypothetical protein [Clostridia bacterium]
MAEKKELFENRSVFKAIMELSIPSVIGQIVLVIYNMADTLFIGMTNSDELITAVTVCMPAFMFLSAISNLFGVGAASVIAGALGKNERAKAENASSFAFWGCISLTLVYCFAVWMFCDRFIDALGGTNQGVHSAAVKYMKCAVVIGGPATTMNTLFSHLVRACGCSVQASMGVALGGILNIVLDPLFMFVILPAGNETLGAALATAISNLCALVYYILMIAVNREKLIISVTPSNRILKNDIPKEIFKVGIAAFLMTMFENISYAILDKQMAFAGISAQAGVGVAKKANMFAHCFVRGMAQGVLPLIAYNFASGNRTRMKRVVYCSASISVGIAGACTASCLLFSREIISVFIHTGGDSLSYGSQFLKILCVGAPFSAFAYTVITFFQATGRGGKSTVLALLRKGVVDIPLMFILGKVVPVYGIVAATPVTDIVCSIIALALFSRFICHHGHDKDCFPR